MSRPSRHGVVLSDLHLYARRSRGFDCWPTLESDLHSAGIIVLNGDTFDFRWSTLLSQEATQTTALTWLRRLISRHEKCEFHFILGNHDCLAGFAQGLTQLSREIDRFHWHEYSLRLGPCLFLHGECSQHLMDATALDRYREPWRRNSHRGGLAVTAYRFADQLGLTRLAHRWHFPRRATVARVRHYLDCTQPGWRDFIRHCYFGHTHLPFSNYPEDGITFHNTGSAIRGMVFNPLRFEVVTPL